MSFQDLEKARPLIRRLLGEQALDSLSESERRTLERLAEVRDGKSDDGPRPLWYWIRDGFWNAPGYVRETLLGLVGDQLDSLVLACRGPKPPPTLPGRLLAPMTNQALRRGVARILTNNDDMFACRLGALIAGMAGFTELLPAIERTAHVGFAASLKRSEMHWALGVLGGSELLRYLDGVEPGEWTTDVRLAYLSRLGDSATRAQIEAALADNGWTVSRMRQYPDLLLRFVEDGGDMLEVVGRLSTVPLWIESIHNPKEASFCAESLARALMLAGERVTAQALAMLFRAGPADLSAALCLELATARYTSVLPLLEPRWASLLSSAPEQRSQSSKDGVYELSWSIAMLRDDGPSWLKSQIDARPQDERLVAAAIGLSLAREDATWLLADLDPESLKAGSLAPLESMRQALTGDGAECVALLAAQDTDDEWFDELQHFYRLARAAGQPVPALKDTIGLFRNADDLRPPVRSEDVDPMRVLGWVRLAERLPLVPILARARFLPPWLACVVLQGLIARKLPTISGPAVWQSDQLALVELGCIEHSQQYIGAGTAALLRLCTGHYPANEPLPEPDRSLAFALFGNPRIESKEMLERLVDLLRGDAAYDALGGLWAYGGRFGTVVLEPRGLRTEIEALGAVRASLRPSDRLSAALCDEVGLFHDDRAQSAATLMASPEAEIRALATDLLFTGLPVSAELVPLRRVHLLDHAEVVRNSILERISEGALSGEELEIAMRASVSSSSKGSRKAVAAAIGRLQRQEYLGTLFRMLQDDDSNVREEVHASLNRMASRGIDGLLFLSIADPWEVCTHYLLSGSPDLSALMRDSRAEAMRLLVQAMEERADASVASQHLGRRLVIGTVQSWPSPPAGSATLSQREFEQLATHLRVLLVDAESGSIVAEVGAEPTGEVLNAMFETGDVALLQVVWS